MFTQAQIIAAARNRIGNSITVAVSEETIPDPAIAGEIRENVLECARIYGASQSRKEAEWVGVLNPRLTAPTPACALAAPTSGSGLAAGTYSYRIASLCDLDTTQTGGAGTIVNPGGQNIALTWTAVQNATSYKIYGRTPRERYLATVTGTSWTDDGTAPLAGGMPIQDSTGRWMQEFPIATFIGSDVLDIVEILRSDAFRSPNFVEPTYDVDPLTGVPGRRSAFIDQGLQEPAFEVATAQARWDEVSKYRWEIFNNGGTAYLRVFPKPDEQVLFKCTYLSQANSIESLPDSARVPIENAACRAFLDCIINRVKSEPADVTRESSLERRAFMETLVKQRDYYAARYHRSVQMGRTATL